ncbi:MAG: tetratricopeptide repeat protein, partial [Elusimicrobia bacterium]|nr:tetratricopeptide repeat protein [Elusimicrobiota bacterium]
RNPYFFQIFLLNVVILILWILYLVDALMKKSFKWSWSPIELPLVVFTGFAVFTWLYAYFSNQPYLIKQIIEDGKNLPGFGINYLYSSIFSEGFKKFIFTLVNLLMAYWIPAMLIPIMYERQERAKFFNTIINTLFFVGFVAAFYGVLQYMEIEPVWPKALNPFGGRPVSTFGNPNFMSSYLVMLFPIILMTYLSQISAAKKILFLGMLEIYFCSIVATMTRSSWVGLFTAFTVIGLFLLKDYRKEKSKSIFAREKKWIIAITIVIIVTFLTWPRSLGGSTPISRITEIENVANTSYGPMHQRIMIWSCAWLMVKDDPILGKGWGLFELYYPFYQGKSLFNDLYRGFRTHANNAHDEILEYWSQIGTLGVAFYLWFLVSFFAYGIYLYKNTFLESKRLIFIGILSGTAGMFLDNIFGNVSTQFCVPAFLYWWNMGTLVGMDDTRKIKEYRLNSVSKGIFAVLIVFFFFLIFKWYNFFLGEINYFQGFKMSKKGDVAAAIPYLEKAHFNNKEVNSEYELANCYARLGQRDKSLWAYYNALSANCGYDEIHFNLATVYAQMGDMEKALNNYTQALYINPISQEGYFALGNIFLINIDKDPDRAIALLERAVFFFPNNIDFWNNLGFAYTKKNDNKKAAEAYRRAVEINPEFQMARHNLEVASQKAGIKSEPILEYDRLVKAAEQKINEKNWPEVLKLCKQLVEISPNSYKARFYLANAFFTLGKVDEAINEYKQAVTISPSNLPSWVNLGLAYSQKNDKENARSAFQKVLELDPKNQIAQERLNYLR